MDYIQTLQEHHKEIAKLRDYSIELADRVATQGEELNKLKEAMKALVLKVRKMEHD